MYLAQAKSRFPELGLPLPPNRYVCTEPRLQRLEAMLGNKLPDAYREFLLWIGGFSKEVYVYESFQRWLKPPLQSLYWLYHSYEYLLPNQKTLRQTLQHIEGVSHPPADALSIQPDGSTHMIFFQLNSGEDPPIHYHLIGTDSYCWNWYDHFSDFLSADLELYAQFMPQQVKRRAVEAVGQQLRAHDVRQRLRAVYAVVQHPRPVLIRQLGFALADSHAEVRRTSAILLAHLGGYGSKLLRAELLDALHDPDPIVRAWVLQAFDEFTPRRVTAAVVPLLDDPDMNVRTQAAILLGTLGDVCARVRLGEAIANTAQTAWDRRVATYTLGLLDVFESRSGIEKQPDPALIVALGDGNPYVRLKAAEALIHQNDHRGVDVLLALLHDEDSGVRKEAVGILGFVGGPRAAQEVTRMLQDSDPDVRISTEHAMNAPPLYLLNSG